MRIEVHRFSVEMERNLRANDHKLGWKDDNPFQLLAKLQEEIGELAVALLNNYGKDIVLKEAADVANMAMMIADVKYGLSIEDSMKRAELRS